MNLTKSQLRQFIIEALDEITEVEDDLEEGKGKAVNPWAICTDSAGRKDKKKYERCVKKVKKKHKIKK